MANIIRNFTGGKMDKSTDERLVQNGLYTDALNIRLGSTENSEVGSVENAKGNTRLTTLRYAGQTLSSSAKCIGAFADGANETVYWFVHDSNFALGSTGVLDLIVSLNVSSNVLTYHVISMDDGTGVTSTLNFSDEYLINDVNLIDRLLFFTDNYNAPRRINIDKSYTAPTGAYVDTILAEDILVVRKPPATSPSVELIDNASSDNYMEDRFICFAYRYRYEDGEVSAISQFSEPAFVPKSFNFDTSSYLNTGMENSINEVVLSYNSGSEFVIGIDLLYKETQSNVVRVIERLDKNKLGLVNNNIYTYRFDNSKVYTVLPNTELLRLYDNVPRLAKTQTVMGNRLIYGNYLEGYNLIDVNGEPVRLEFISSLVSNDITGGVVNGSLTDGVYTIDDGLTITDASAVFDLEGINLVAGSLLELSVTLSHDSFSGFASPTQQTDGIDISFTYILPETYDTVNDLATSTDFLEKVGTAANIQTVANSCDGNTFTDAFNCEIPSSLDTYDKTASGITADGEPISVSSTVSGTTITLQFPAMRFNDGVNDVFEYYVSSNPIVRYREIASSQSLHSNRDYEIGIVYMDDFNRSTTALVSPENNIHVPCSASDKQNIIRATIPTTQVSPSFATRYKFVIKPSKSESNTIYSNIFYKDPEENATYFLLEGENARKVESGDRLIVKSDSNGPKDTCSYATVLEKEVKEENFISGDSGVLNQIGGTYMKIKTKEFVAQVEGDDSPSTVSFASITTEERTKGDFPRQGYTVNIESSTGGVYNDYTVPVGAIINISIEFRRNSRGDKEERFWSVDTSFISPIEYADFKAWWDGENIATAIESQATKYTVPSGFPQLPISYNSTIDSSATIEDALAAMPAEGTTNYLRFWREPSPSSGDGRLALLLTGDKSEKQKTTIGDNGAAFITTQISVVRTGSTIVFETLPEDASPDIWYESSQSFAIDSSGNHAGNVQGQSISLGVPAVIDTAFFNCYTFGNGVESEKIRDSIVGKPLVLGNRVTSVSDQDFKEIRRFADLTYSGVYNDESNLNKLNEFNLGLANFKPLEDLYGPVNKISGRETDILVLQEDKISYVLSGKNLVSDSTGGGAIASIPEVLGTQIARNEEYGISNNPESFVPWGYNKYFTDTKRGVVLKLTGSSTSEQLQVISSMGMRPWFRDLFIDSFNTQKIGGYDPYMDEYVLSSNDVQLPTEVVCADCGSTRTYTVTAGTNLTFCVDVGDLVGDLDIDYTIISIDENVTINATYDGSTDTTGAVSSSGTLAVTKDKVSEDQIDLEVISSSGSVELELTVGCPSADNVTIVLVTVGDNKDLNKLIHNEYRWVDGTFNSPLHSNQVQMIGGTDYPLVSQYDTLSGPQGAGFIPSNTATVSIISNKKEGDDFDFSTATDRLLYLRSDTLYENSTTDIASLLAAATEATPFSFNGQSVLSTFDMPDVGDYLYLIWDYRTPSAAILCYSESSSSESCCSCGGEDGCDCATYSIVNSNNYTVAVGYTDCDTSTAATIKIIANQSATVSSETEPTISATSPTGSGANLTITYVDCGDTGNAGDNCFTNTNSPAQIRMGQTSSGVASITISSNSPFTAIQPIAPFASDNASVSFNGTLGYYVIDTTTPVTVPTVNMGSNYCTSDGTVSFTIDCSATTANSGIPSLVDNQLFLIDNSGTPIPATVDSTTNQVVVTFGLGSRQLDLIRWKNGSYIKLSWL